MKTVSIRLYNDSDFEMVSSWWKSSSFTDVRRTTIPDTTYILEVDGVPTFTACLFLMNCRDACMIENLVGNPALKGERSEHLPALFAHLENVAKERGYLSVVLFSYEDKLKRKYEELGYMKTLENVTTFAKRVA